MFEAARRATFPALLRHWWGNETRVKRKQPVYLQSTSFSLTDFCANMREAMLKFLAAGTTVATNALLERKGERTALCVTKVSLLADL